MTKLLFAILLLFPGFAWGQFNFGQIIPAVIESNTDELISVTFNSDSTQIILTIKSDYWHQMIGHNPSMYRDVYGIVNGKIQKIKRIYADYTPEHMETIPERIEWKDEK